MSRICAKCGFTMDDSAVFCPACGAVFEDKALEKQNAAKPFDRFDPRYATPINNNRQHYYAQPMQSNAQPSPVSGGPAPAAVRQKKPLPYILAGVGAAALIFTVALIIVLTVGGKKLEGKYTWTTGGEITGTLEINKNNSGLLTMSDGRALTMSFSPKDKTVTYTGSDGLVSGTYTFDGKTLSVTSNGFTDKFEKK